MTNARAAGPDAASFRYRIGFGTWVNDMRPEPLPLDQWPSPRFDDLTVEGLFRTLDTMAAAGYQYLDAFGLWGTNDYPPDIVSAFADRERNRRVERVLQAARARGIEMVLPLGVFTWGYGRIIRDDPAVRGLDDRGQPHPHAMCGARDRAWGYLERLIDTFFARHDFAAVHLESADLGYCACPECAGRDGSVAYNARLNQRAAQYIKSRWPACLVYVCPINWAPWGLGASGQQRTFTAEQMQAVRALSQHIDLFMDQGHRGRFIDDCGIAELACAYGTSGGLWAYHGCRMDRLSYLLPYPTRAARHLAEHHRLGARGALVYQGPMVNPAVELNSTVAGLAMQDVRRDPAELIGEAIDQLYRPVTQAAADSLAALFASLEEAYFGAWDAGRFTAGQAMEVPGEFCLGPLFNTFPDPPVFLLEPYLDAFGRQALKTALRGALAAAEDLHGAFDDGGRLRRLRRALQVMAQLLSAVMLARGEAGGS